MLVHPLQKNILEFLLTLYEDGKKRDKLFPFALKETIDAIAFLSKMKMKKEKKLYMLEYLHKNKKIISKIKLNFCEKNFQLTNLLDQELILKEKVLRPFWTTYSSKISKKLWFPLKTDLLDMGLICSNTYSLSSVQNSHLLIPKYAKLMNKSSQKIYLPSLQFSRKNLTEKENTIKITRKIRIYPNEKQKLLFNKYFGATRYIYNNVVEFTNNKRKENIKRLDELVVNGCIAEKNNKQCKNNLESKYLCKKHQKYKIKNNYELTVPYLRSKCLNNNNNLPDKELWLKDVPYDTRQLVIKDFVGATKSAISNYKNGNNMGFNMKFKSKKNNTQIFHIDKNALKTDLNLFKRKKMKKLRTRNKMTKWIKNNIKKIESDCKIIRYNPSQYYLLLTINSKQKISNSLFNTVALDPGVRTFQTFYSSDGMAGKLGDNFTDKNLIKIGKKIDKNCSVISKSKNGKTKRNLRKRNNLLRTKIKNSISDLHWKSINFLTNNFKTIILPEFKVKEMTALTKEGRKINNVTTRKMLLLSHYKFQQKLKYKCKSLNRILMVVNESYTSKTCGNCGRQNKTLDGNKVFECNNCKIKIDRDMNGARNILLKTLTKINNLK